MSATISLTYYQSEVDEDAFMDAVVDAFQQHLQGNFYQFTPPKDEVLDPDKLPNPKIERDMAKERGKHVFENMTS